MYDPRLNKRGFPFGGSFSKYGGTTQKSRGSFKKFGGTQANTISQTYRRLYPPANRFANCKCCHAV